MSHFQHALAWGALALWACALPAHAQGGAAFELVTQEEARQAAQAQARAPAAVRSRGAGTPRDAAPAIRVLSPVANGAPVAAPLRIELAFKPAPGTRILPESFRVLYGLLKIDLTQRLRQHATVSESGVVVERAQVPDGQHRLILQVSDDKGNAAEQELRVRVGAAS